jgi:hypothetical protein
VDGADGAVVVTRWDGTRCTYSIDLERLRLEPIVATGCEVLGISS